MKEQILAIVQAKPTSTRGIGEQIRRRRVDVAEACRDLQAAGLLQYDAPHRAWRIPDAPAAPSEPQAVETPAPKRTTEPTFAAREILRDDQIGVLVTETAPGSFSIKCPSHLQADIAESIVALTNQRIDHERAAAPPLTGAERRTLRNMVIGRVMWGAL